MSNSPVTIAANFLSMEENHFTGLNKSKILMKAISLAKRKLTVPAQWLAQNNRTSGMRCLSRLGVLSLLISTAVQAQEFAIERFSVTVGNGTMSGGAFTVSGSFRQSIFTTMTGGVFTVEDSHWSEISIVNDEGAPRIEIVREGRSGALTLRWPGTPDDGWTLETSTTLGLENNPWEALPYRSVQSDGPHRFITINNPVGSTYYRLTKP